MGSIFSSLTESRKATRELNAIYAAAAQRANSSPGKPVAGPTASLWQEPPSALAQHKSPSLPEEVDVLIIGSGITACSIAYHLFHRSDDRPQPTVAIIEARELCSGATGRNAGMIKVVPYLEWGTLVKRFGRSSAFDIMRFRMGHFQNILEFAEKEGLEEIAAVREVESIDVYGDAEAWGKAKEKLRIWLEAFPDQKDKWRAVEAEEARKVGSIDPHSCPSH